VIANSACPSTEDSESSQKCLSHKNNKRAKANELQAEPLQLQQSTTKKRKLASGGISKNSEQPGGLQPSTAPSRDEALALVATQTYETPSKPRAKQTQRANFLFPEHATDMMICIVDEKEESSSSSDSDSSGEAERGREEANHCNKENIPPRGSNETASTTAHARHQRARPTNARGNAKTTPQSPQASKTVKKAKTPRQNTKAKKKLNQHEVEATENSSNIVTSPRAKFPSSAFAKSPSKLCQFASETTSPEKAKKLSEMNDFLKGCAAIRPHSGKLVNDTKLISSALRADREEEESVEEGMKTASVSRSMEEESTQEVEEIEAMARRNGKYCIKIFDATIDADKNREEREEIAEECGFARQESPFVDANLREDKSTVVVVNEAEWDSDWEFGEEMRSEKVNERLRICDIPPEDEYYACCEAADVEARLWKERLQEYESDLLECASNGEIENAREGSAMQVENTNNSKFLPTLQSDLRFLADLLPVELDQELKSIQTIQIVVGSNTIYCQ
jgi:hypothetical protein